MPQAPGYLKNLVGWLAVIVNHIAASLVHMSWDLAVFAVVGGKFVRMIYHMTITKVSHFEKSVGDLFGI